MIKHVRAPKTSQHPLPETPGIDLSFRPASYFWPLGLEKHLLARIKGAERKAGLKRLIDARHLDEVAAFLGRSALSEVERKAIGRIHPALMGGEYLPDLSQNEVMIASITIASTTQDVTSVYARRGKSRIRYRVVDEYEGETLSGRNMRTSAQPLSLGQLEEFFNAAWSIFDVLDMNFVGSGYRLEQMLQFVVSIESQFYPQLGELYERRITTWATDRRADLDTRAEDEEPERQTTDDTQS